MLTPWLTSLALLPLAIAHAAPTTTIYSPESGVICDTLAGFCADRYGISLGITQIYLGDEAQTRLLHAISPSEQVDLRAYTLSSGVHCDSQAAQCYQDRYFPRTNEHDITAILFGNAPQPSPAAADEQQLAP